MERHSELLQAIREEHGKELSVISQELQFVEDFIVGKGTDIVHSITPELGLGVV